jgi:hypothetical protein
MLPYLLLDLDPIKLLLPKDPLALLVKLLLLPLLVSLKSDLLTDLLELPDLLKKEDTREHEI